MQTLVTGATGFIGRHLLPHLQRPVVLSRAGARQRAALGALDVTSYDWSIAKGPPPVQAFDGVEVVVHLAGESVAERWTRAKKQRILDSRVIGTSQLVTTLSQLARPPRVLISASAVGYYGSRGEQLLSEDDSPGSDFLAGVCVAWEAAASAAAKSGTRVVLLRTGLVFGRDGGALARMLPLFRLGLGGRLGNGRQWLPWVHVDDLIRMILFLIDHVTLSGPVNATSLYPVTNADFTQTLGKTLRRPTFCAMPAPLLRLAVGEIADALLASQRVMPRVLTREGFEYRFPQLEQALSNILQE
ncbi:MAG: TIGR01777 family oxidoreductase [Pirellulaceae bacterium]